MLKKLHHNAYRCRDSEETRRFYEDFLGLPLADAFPITQTKTGRQTQVLHSFYRMGDGSFLAFFEAPDMPFDFKVQHDFDLHIALEVDYPFLESMRQKGLALGMDVRGPSDHGFIHSIYFRDPNGYVVELTSPVGQPPEPAQAQARAAANLRQWQAAKAWLQNLGATKGNHRRRWLALYTWACLQINQRTGRGLA